MWLGRLARGALLPRARLVAPPLIEAKPLLRSAQSGGATLRRLLSTSTGTASGESGGAGGVGGALKSWAQFGLSLGAFVAADQLLKKSLKEAGVTRPRLVGEVEYISARLVEYRDREGDCDVPKRHEEDGAKLGQWHDSNTHQPLPTERDD